MRNFILLSLFILLFLFPLEANADGGTIYLYGGAQANTYYAIPQGLAAFQPDNYGNLVPLWMAQIINTSYNLIYTQYSGNIIFVNMSYLPPANLSQLFFGIPISYNPLGTPSWYNTFLMPNNITYSYNATVGDTSINLTFSGSGDFAGTTLSFPTPLGATTNTVKMTPITAPIIVNGVLVMSETIKWLPNATVSSYYNSLYGPYIVWYNPSTSYIYKYNSPSTSISGSQLTIAFSSAGSVAASYYPGGTNYITFSAPFTFSYTINIPIIQQDQLQISDIAIISGGFNSTLITQTNNVIYNVYYTTPQGINWSGLGNITLPFVSDLQTYKNYMAIAIISFTALLSTGVLAPAVAILIVSETLAFNYMGWLNVSSSVIGLATALVLMGLARMVKSA